MIQKQSNACTHTHTTSTKNNHHHFVCVCVWSINQTIQTLNAGAQKKTDFGPMGPFMKALNLEAMFVVMIVVLVVMILIMMVRVVCWVSQQHGPAKVTYARISHAQSGIAQFKNTSSNSLISPVFKTKERPTIKYTALTKPKNPEKKTKKASPRGHRHTTPTTPL